MTRTEATMLTIAFGLLPAVWLHASAQNETASDIERLIEVFLEESEEGTDQTQWLEEMTDLLENPLNINTASKVELLRIPFLNEALADNIIEYRNKSGYFISRTELTSVAGIGRDLAEKIAGFIYTGSEAEKSIPGTRSSGYLQHQLLLKGWRGFPRPAGYLPRGDKPPAFAGSPMKLYARYILQSGRDFQAGFTGDSDPGELFFKGINKYGFDFYSAHVSLRLNDLIPRIIIGDYGLRTGQGLVLWQGFSMGKSAEVLQVSRPPTQLSPYTSSDENFFFRGVATSFRHNNLQAILFLSSKNSDGNLNEDGEGNISFSSLQTSGYHRTASEMEDKNSVRHSIAGMVSGLSLNKVYFGFNFLAERFRYPLIRSGQPYQQFLFTGRENANVSFDYRYIPGKYQFFGELAMSASGGTAMIHGLTGRLHDQVNVAMVWRKYARDYHATWGNAFGENSRNANETGFYTGVKAYPFPGITLSAFADVFRSDWLNYLTAGPTDGFEYLAQLDWRHGRKFTGTVRWKSKQKSSRVKTGNLYEDIVSLKQGFRINIRYQVNRQWYVRSRFEQSAYRFESGEKGMLVLQDLGYTPSRIPVSATVRCAWFRTDGYNSRIYVYENDLLYNFSTLAFYGNGTRTYLNLRIPVVSGLDCWIKAGHTRYKGVEEISSGNSKIAGNTKSEVKIQMRYRF